MQKIKELIPLLFEEDIEGINFLQIKSDVDSKWVLQSNEEAQNKEERTNPIKAARLGKLIQKATDSEFIKISIIKKKLFFKNLNNYS